MKKSSDKLHRIVNIILGVFYIPYGIFAFLCYMATEVLITENHPLMVIAINLFAHTGILVALTAHICLLISHRFYDSGRIKLSYIIRFMPIWLLLLTFLFWGAAEAFIYGI